jgi:hypothetical protein
MDDIDFEKINPETTSEKLLYLLVVELKKLNQQIKNRRK